MKMGKIQAVCVLLMLTGAMAAFGIEITGTAPTFKTTSMGSTLGFDLVIDYFNTQLADVFEKARTDINKEIKDINDKPEKFIKAWGNSSVYASHGATQRGYGGYDLFAFTIGSMVGVQLPSSPFTIVDEMNDLTDKLNNERDLKLGINPQILTGQLSLNTSKFLVKDLYLGLRFGYMKLDSLGGIDGLSFKSTSFGLTANYQLMPHKKLAGGLVGWRGINLGTGFIYQGTNIDYSLKLDPIKESINLTSQIPGGLLAGLPTIDHATMTIDPSLSLAIDVTTFTIPLEVTTSVKFLWIMNFALGAGVDIGFGKSDIKMGINGDVNLDLGTNQFIEQATPGNLAVNAGGKMSPSIFNPKLMTGLGFSLGPVIIDVPLTWYFMDDGFNVGVTIGIVW